MVIKLADILKLVNVLEPFILLLLNAEPQVVFSACFRVLSLHSVLLFSASYCSDLVHFSSLGTRDDLTVLVFDR